MSCFSYTFQKCREESSGARVLDDIFNVLNNYDISTMFDNPQKSIDLATDMAYRSMVSSLLSKEGKLKDKTSILLGERFMEDYSYGDYIELWAKSKESIYIDKIWLNVDFTGTVHISFVNELGVETLKEVLLVVAGVTKEVAIDLSFKYVKIKISENIEGRNTYDYSVAGMLISYSRVCDYNTYICDNKERFQTAMDFKVASILLTDGQFSGELDKRKMMSESYTELKAEYETQYQMELNNLSLMDSGCFDCGQRIKITQWI